MPSVRLVLISDTHGQHRLLPPLPAGDILIHAGDFMYTGREPREIADFLLWLDEQPHAHKIFIAGNHDRAMEGGVGESLLTLDHAPELRTHYLQDTSVTLLGLRFYGAPWTPEFMSWAFMGKRGAEMRAHWDLIPSTPGLAPDVLITHGPAKGIRDTFYDLHTHAEISLGCGELAKAIVRVRPRLHVFGHIHFGYGEEEKEGTRYVNAALLDDRYRIRNAPVVVDLEVAAEVAASAEEPD